VLDDRSTRKFSQDEKALLWQKVVQKVLSFNGTSWIHRDLKAANIVVITVKDGEGRETFDIRLIDIEGAKRFPIKINRGE
jgi:serine/threonine protein kinase